MKTRPLASVVAVGDELLNGGVSDTNTARIALALQGVGIDLLLSLAVRDREEEIVEGIRYAMKRCPLVFVCGGIGPTEDDLTRQAVARALELPLMLDEEGWKGIKERLRARGIPARPGHEKQAMVPKGAISLPNRVGSALGAVVRQGEKMLVMLPGVPKEVGPMLEEAISLLPAQWKDASTQVVRLRSFGLPESEINSLLEPIWRDEGIFLGLRVLSPRHTEIRIRGKSETVATAREKALKALGDAVYSQKGEALEEVVGRLLTSQGKTIATAESCTGGMISHTITNVPGSSNYMLAGLVTYSNQAKEKILGVSHGTLVEHGAVSHETAKEMVQGLKRVSNAHCCVAVTGIAGPGGGTPQKPVGLVFAGFHLDGECWVKEYRFSGTRIEIKTLTTMSVLDEIRRRLEERE